MPINISQILDLLLGLVLIMFVPIGFWRGALREWLTLAGIALGLLLATSWSERGGAFLAPILALDSNLAAFTAGAICLLGATLCVGYAGGVTLPYRPDLSGTNRWLGALLGLGNGILIVSGLLQLMQRTLFASHSDSSLKTSGLAKFLIESTGWVYLLLVLFFIGCVIAGLFRRFMEGTPLMEEYQPLHQFNPATTRVEESKSPSATPATDDDEAGPPIRLQPAPETQSSQKTAVLQIVPKPTASDTNQPAPNTDPQPAALPEAKTKAVTTIPRRPTAMAPSHIALVPAAKSEQETATTTPPDTDNTELQAPPTAAVPTVEAQAPVASTTTPASTPAADSEQQESICPSCHSPTAPNARFCLVCGHLIGAAEKRQLARQL